VKLRKALFCIQKSKGFTLVEIAIVLLVFGLVIGGLMGPLQVQIESLDRKATVKEIGLIKEAIVGFTIINGRLPCPDIDGDGGADMLVTDCVELHGKVPWATLGVGMTDGWKRPFTYHVAKIFAYDIDGDDGDYDGDGDVDNPDCFATATTSNVAFEICSIGDINVLDGYGGNPVASNVPAIIVSHGKNWAETSGNDEGENEDDNTNFVDKTYASGGNNNYDDIVDWVNLNSLIAKMVAAKKLP